MDAINEFLAGLAQVNASSVLSVMVPRSCALKWLSSAETACQALPWKFSPMPAMGNGKAEMQSKMEIC
jgi:hypothetical protein